MPRLLLFCHKEEIGSDGNTGAKSAFFKNFLQELLRLKGEDYGSYQLDPKKGFAYRRTMCRYAIYLSVQMQIATLLDRDALFCQSLPIVRS